MYFFGGDKIADELCISFNLILRLARYPKCLKLGRLYPFSKVTTNRKVILQIIEA